MTNSLPQRASALKSEARRTLLANRDQIRLAEQNKQPSVLASYTNQRADLIREAATVLSATEITDLTGLTRQRVHQILNPPSGDALKERGTRQAEYELQVSADQQSDNPIPENFENLLTVARNVYNANALPLVRIQEITGLSAQDIAPPPPAHLRIPEADV